MFFYQLAAVAAVDAAAENSAQLSCDEMADHDTEIDATDPDLTVAVLSDPEATSGLPPHYIHSHINYDLNNLRVDDIVQLCPPNNSTDPLTKSLSFKVGKVIEIVSDEDTGGVISTKVEFLCCCPGKSSKPDKRSRLRFVVGRTRRIIQLDAANQRQFSMLRILSRGESLPRVFCELSKWERMDTMACLLVDLATGCSTWSGTTSSKMQTVLNAHQTSMIQTLAEFQTASATTNRLPKVSKDLVTYIHPDRASVE